MKHAKKLLACLLAGVLALAVFTACDGVGAVASAGTDAEKGQALAQELNIAYTQELENKASEIASWMADSTAVKQVNLELCRMVVISDESWGYWMNGDLNDFLYYAGCYAAGDSSLSFGMRAEGDTLDRTAMLCFPQADNAAALAGYAAGCSEMGAAFIDYNGTTYVVAVFR